MIMHFRALSSAIVLLSSSAALAQVQVAPPATVITAPTSSAQQASHTLRAGTAVSLKMRETLTTKGKNLRVGQRFQLEVAEPVMIGGQVVIPAGSPATGEVTDVRNKGMWGKSGNINARVLFVRANGQQIRLTGALNDKGVTGTAGVVGAIALVPIAGFLVTGTSAEIPLGAPVNAFIDEDVPVAFAQGAGPAPAMVVSASAPAAASEPVAAPAVKAPVNGIIALYQGDKFTGRKVVVKDDMPNLTDRQFYQMARSVSFGADAGTWELCSKPNFGGRCEKLTGSKEDLREIKFDRMVASARRVK